MKLESLFVRKKFYVLLHGVELDGMNLKGQIPSSPVLIFLR